LRSWLGTIDLGEAIHGDVPAFNKGLCVMTTRTQVGDIADNEASSALRLDLEQLSSNAGAKGTHADAAGFDRRDIFPPARLR